MTPRPTTLNWRRLGKNNETLYSRVINGTDCETKSLLNNFAKVCNIDIYIFYILHKKSSIYLLKPAKCAH